MAKYWEIRAFDNFGAPGEADVRTIGRYASAEDALRAAKRHVRESLEEQLPGASSADEMFNRFTNFGEEPVIFEPEGEEDLEFSARTYASEIAEAVFLEASRDD